ncbi:MAG: DNA mismatch repair endonuclease MutL [Planctomycetota bacterium]|nr:DNA mismatch repair endonuclease MutL [Planctomycetota bacterium]
MPDPEHSSGSAPAASIQNPESEIQNPSIHVLPEAVASRIAAGEVVERPASVVKELVENALDAGARTIHVELAGGGRELVRVTDDGCGMSREDLALAILPHATSKLAAVEDLESLTTLGFRGEALPSIAAVSRFTLTSCLRLAGGEKRADASAWRIEISGGEPAHPQARPAAGAYGTTVEVRDLFLNVPARAKFLKGPGTEAAACTDALLRLALTRPEVSFTLRQGRHEIFSVAACASAAAAPLERFLSRARAVLGRSASEGLLELGVAGPGDSSSSPMGAQVLPDTYRGYRLYGLLSPPAISRPSRASIYLAVNGRPVRDRTLTSALLESYRHLLPPRRYPIAVLFLDMPGADVDINVHPTKAEVRFRLPGLVYALLHHAVRTACATAGGAALDPRSGEPAANAPAAERTASAPQDSRPRQSQQTFDLWPKASSPQAHAAAAEFAGTAPASRPSPPAARYAPLEPQPSAGSRVADEAAVFAAPPPQPPPLSAQPRPVASRGPSHATQASPFRILGQAGGSYIILEDDTGIKLLDQHALHERILFEHLLARAEGRARGDSQGLLIAETLELTPSQAAVFSADTAAAEMLTQLGFDVEPFGPRAVVVRAVPAVLKSAAAAGLVPDVLDALADGGGPAGAGSPASRAHYREKAVYVVACKGAIKAGERLTMEQMNALVTEYHRFAGSSFTCPHGRPAALEISWEELERAVGRK